MAKGDPLSLPTSRERADAVEELGSCGIAAHGAVRASMNDIAKLRSNPGPYRGEPFAPTLLRNSDEQTVVGLAAVLQAIERFRLSPSALTDWGLVAAPRYLGRLCMAQALDNFQRTGPSLVSPLIVPHRSLHSLSGTLSLALDLRGPNLSAGGGPGALADGLQTALALVQEPNLPGIWLVLTEWDPEPTPDVRGQATQPCTCLGVALALVPATRICSGSRLCLQRHHRAAGFTEGQGLKPSLASLVTVLTAATPASAYRQWTFRLGWNAEMVLTLDDKPSRPPTCPGVSGGLALLAEAQP